MSENEETISKAKILIIDDDKSLSQAISRKLLKLDHCPKAVGTLQAASEAVAQENYDLILLDVSLPDGNGLEYIARFRQTESQPEVIIMTGYGDPDGAELAIKNGAWCYLEKVSIIKEMTLPLTRALQYRAERRKAAQIPMVLKRKNLVGKSAQIVNALNTLAKAAQCDASVLLTGETGTGKEVFARTIHKNSPRAAGNFVVVDCAALPEKLVESTLFGHVKGAFTGAEQENRGLIKQADGGTLFLDEIGELPLAMQKAFLRVLQEKNFRPVGSPKEIRSDFRLISATNCDLDELMNQGLFRDDLLFRIQSFRIELPPLRERLEDIKDLSYYFIDMLCERYGHEPKGFSPDFFDSLQKYDWPGNVRELFNTLDYVFASAIHAPIIYPNHLPEKIRIHFARAGVRKSANENQSPCSGALPMEWRQAKDVFEKHYLEQLLAAANNNIQEASHLSGLSRTRLYQLLNKFNLPL